MLHLSNIVKADFGKNFILWVFFPYGRKHNIFNFKINYTTSLNMTEICPFGQILLKSVTALTDRKTSFQNTQTKSKLDINTFV